MGNEYLTTAEMEAKYPGQWVLLDRPGIGKTGMIAGGVVLAHAADRDEFDAKLDGFDADRKAVYYVYDEFADPIEMLTPFFDFEYEWTTDSMPGDTTSTSPPG